MSVSHLVKEKRWWQEAVVYQIYPRSFMDLNNDGIGDLQGIISKLDYLKKLGTDVLWLSPVYKSPMDDNGYDISDYTDIAPEFGTMDDMEQLLTMAKSYDMKIIMDLVVNHTSDDHNWFKESRKSKDNPYRDYYIWRDPNEDGSTPSDINSIFGGSAWQFDELTGQYYFHLFTKRQPDLNWENPKVIAEVHKMMNWWIDKGIGGFRLDVIDLIGKEIDKGITGNGPRLHQLLFDMNKNTFGDKDLMTVGETWGANPESAKLYSNEVRSELSMVFQFEHIAIGWENGDKWNQKELNILELKKSLIRWQVELADEGWNSLFWNNHDLPRAVSKYGDPGKYRERSAKMLATSLHFLKGTPYIYQGEEIGMTNIQFDSIEDYRDVETLNFYKEQKDKGVEDAQILNAIYKNGRDNARTPMQWDDKVNGGFSKTTPWIKSNTNCNEINVEKALADPSSIFYHYQKLIQLRKDLAVIVYGSFKPIFIDDPYVFAYVRTYNTDNLFVVNNLSDQTLKLELPAELQDLSGTSLISNISPIARLEKEIELEPYESFAILFDIN